MRLFRNLFLVDVDKPEPAKNGALVKQEPIPSASMTDQMRASFLVGTPEIDPVGAKFLRAKAWPSFRDMRRDPVLSSCLELKTYLPTKNGWEVEPASEESQHVEQAEWVTEALDSMCCGVMSVIDKALDAVAVGFSVQQKIWALLDGKLVIVDTIAHDPQGISFDVDDQWRVYNIRITLSGSTEYREQYPVDRFIYWTYNPLYGHPYGHGDFLEAYRAWYVKNQAIILWVRYLEKHASGTRIVTFPATMTLEQQVELKLEIFKEGSLSAVMIPEGVQLEINHGVAGQSAAAYTDVMSWANEEMARAVLGSSLMVDEGSRVGSKAMASVHMETAIAGAMQLSRLIETEVIGKQLIEPMIRANYPGETKFPKFVLPQPSASEMEKLSARIFAAIDRGIVSEDEPFVRSDLGFPPDSRTDAEKAEDAVGKTIQEIAAGIEAEQRGKERRRILAESPPKLDHRRIERILDTAEAVYRKVWKRLINRYLSGLTEADIALEQFEMPEYLAGTLRAGVRLLALSMRHEGRKSLGVGEKFALEEDPWQADKLLDGILEQIPEKAKEIVERTLAEGGGIREAMKALKVEFPTWAKHKMERIARTVAAFHFNHGRLDVMLDAGIKYYEVSAILDSRVCPICFGLDDLVISLDSDLDAWPPFHWSCRCICSPVIDPPEKVIYTYDELKAAASKRLQDAGFMIGEHPVTEWPGVPAGWGVAPRFAKPSIPRDVEVPRLPALDLDALGPLIGAIAIVGTLEALRRVSMKELQALFDKHPDRLPKSAQKAVDALRRQTGISESRAIGILWKQARKEVLE